LDLDDPYVKLADRGRRSGGGGVHSLRNGFGDAQKGFDLFMDALSKPGGMAAAEKL
jgi:hypothetical protein